jgi:hypothetical protein
MYTVNYWLIKLKDYPEDLKKYTIHIVAETQEDARRVAEDRHGRDSLACDPILDNPINERKI